MTTPQPPALDYEHVKDIFYAKLAADRHGRGRMESAFYHTAQWIFQQGIASQDELLARIAELETQTETLRSALHAHGVEAAGLIEQRDDLLVASRAVIDRWNSPSWKDLPHTGQFIARLSDAIAKAETVHA